MVKALIIDDNQADRKTISYALNQFDEISVAELDSGAQAIELCKTKQFDVIFVALEIGGEISGLETISKLRWLDKSAFIICLSVDTSAEIIHSLAKVGGDSYIGKPIKPHILRLRFKAYKKLLEHNSIIGFEDSIKNVFNTPVFDYMLTFKITYEGSLARFWEHYATHFDDDISKCVNAVFNIGTKFLTKNQKLFIFVEFTEQNTIFTLYVPSLLGNLDVEPELKKTNLEYKISDNRFSIKCNIEQEETICEPNFEEEQTKDIKAIQTQPYKKEPCVVEIKVYDFMDRQDLIELGDNISDLESSLALLQYSSLDSSEVLSIADTFNKLSKLLVGYNETYAISDAFFSLSNAIASNIQSFIDKSQQLSNLFIVFCADIAEWRMSLFFNGAPSHDFMDSTIIANAQTIENIIAHREVNESVDDIFNF